MTQRPGRILTLVGVILVLGFYAEALVHAPVTGQDLRNFYAAATLLQHGGNPYDAGPFLGQQEALYHPIHAADRAALAGNPYVQGPPLAIALMPFVGAAPSTVYVFWAVTLGLCAAMALVTLARLWPTARSTRRAFLLLISPVTFLGILLGQPDAVLLLALVLALWTLERDHPWSSGLSGLLLTVGLIKPQLIAGPIVLLAVLAWRRGRLAPYAGGVLGGTALFLALSLIVAGPAVVGGWIGELAGFGASTVYTQVDISSLTTLYVGWAPRGLSLILLALALMGWAALCVYTWQKGGTSEDPRWWLGVGLVGWLLVTPYAHPHDDILLLPAVWLLLGRAPSPPAHADPSLGSAEPTAQPALPVRGRGEHKCPSPRRPSAGGEGSEGRNVRVVNRGLVLVLVITLVAAWWLLPMTSVLGLRPPLIRGLGIVPVALLLVALLSLRPRAGDLSAPARQRSVGGWRPIGLLALGTTSPRPSGKRRWSVTPRTPSRWPYPKPRRRRT